MYNFKIFGFGEELHGGTYHLLLNSILKKEYSNNWRESKTELDEIPWFSHPEKITEYEKTKFKRYKRYENYYFFNNKKDKNIMDRLPKSIEKKENIFNWDFCSESKWSKIGVIIPELFFLDSKEEMALFFNKFNYKAQPISKIINKKSKENDFLFFFNKRVFIKSSGFSVYKADNSENNNSGNSIKVIHSLKKEDIKNEISQLKKDETKVIQISIEPLMLFRKKKFDIRYHVLFLLNNNELFIFSHEYNFCRLTLDNYDPNSLKNGNFITNYNFQGLDQNFKVENCQVMSYKLPNYEEIETKIKEKIIELGQIIVKNIKFKKRNKPEIWLTGFDFIIDENRNPWLLEINHNPGFTTPIPKNKYEKVNLQGVRSLIDFFLIPLLEKKEISKENQGVFNYLFSSKIYS